MGITTLQMSWAGIEVMCLKTNTQRVQGRYLNPGSLIPEPAWLSSVETGQGAKRWHSKLSSFCFLFRRERRKEKKETETEAPVQHLRRPHQVTLLAQADFSIWFSFYLRFCFAAVIFKYLSLNRWGLCGEGASTTWGGTKKILNTCIFQLPIFTQK